MLLNEIIILGITFLHPSGQLVASTNVAAGQSIQSVERENAMKCQMQTIYRILSSQFQQDWQRSSSALENAVCIAVDMWKINRSNVVAAAVAVVAHPCMIETKQVAQHERV